MQADIENYSERAILDRQRIEREQKEKKQQSEKLAALAGKVEDNSSYAARALQYLKENPATSAMAAGAVAAGFSGSGWTAAALTAAIGMGAGKALDNSDTGTKVLAAASAAAYISGRPMLAVAIGAAAYMGLGKSLFGSSQNYEPHDMVGLRGTPKGADPLASDKASLKEAAIATYDNARAGLNMEQSEQLQLQPSVNRPRMR